MQALKQAIIGKKKKSQTKTKPKLSRKPNQTKKPPEYKISFIFISHNAMINSQ